MRLTRLTLDRYGAFTDLGVSFGPGLTVVYGPNESGKSTLLHAIGDVLWGLAPRQHPYAFELAPSRLKVTAELVGSAGPQTFAVTSRGRLSADGDVVQPWWDSGPVASRKAWETGFGIDRDRLREGGRAVLRDGGDLADLLFQARTGVDLAAARARLLEQADAIWRSHRGARTVSLRVAKERADEFAGQLARAINSADMVAELETELQRADADLATARTAHARASAARDAAQRDGRAHRFACRLAGIRRRIDEVTDAGAVLSESELHRHDEAASALEAVERDLLDLETRLAELDATPLPPLDEDALAVAHLVEEARRGDEAEAERQARMQRQEGKRGRLLRDLREAAADVDPGLALADEAALRRQAPTLVLPTDAVDLLNRSAEAVATARRELDEAAEALEAAEADLLPSAPTGERGALGRWEEARQARDRAWERVREPWMSGDLPALDVRAAMASEVDGALEATDFAAGEAAAEAEEHVETQTRAEERRRWLEKARGDHEQAAGTHAELLDQWRLSLRTCGLPDVLDPPAWMVRSETLRRVSDLLAQLAGIDTEIREMAADAGVFQERIAAAVSPLGLDPSDPLAALALAYERVAGAREAQVAAIEYAGKQTVIIGERAKKETARRQAREILDALVAGSDGDLDVLVSRSRTLLELRQAEQAVLDELRAAAPDDDPDDLVSRLAALSDADVREALGRAEDGAGEALDEFEAKKERRANLAKELKDAKEDRDAAVLRQQQVESLDEMAELARRWAKLQIMAGILEQVLRAAEPQTDASLLAYASSLADALTGGRVQGLSASEGSGDRRGLLIQLSGDRDADDDGLSEGTSDQVFLALRLAGIRERQEAAAAVGCEKLPVVLDDVLMAHDDPRTTAALRVLVDEARDQQITLFTHHGAVAEAARDAGATVVELAAPPTDGNRSSSTTPRHLQPAERSPDHTDRQVVVDTVQVRAWARARGLAVGERGRIPAEIIAAYRARKSVDE